MMIDLFQQVIVVGHFKGELGGKIIEEFCGL